MKKFLFAIVAVFVATGAFAQSGYRVSPGDTLQIEVLEDPSLNRSVLVLPDGTISFPFAGSVRASGRTAGEISAAIASGISSNFASAPNVFVGVADTAPRTSSGPATIDVFIMGEVTSPGEREVERGTTLIQALATGGSFTPFAATKRILLRRTGKGGKQAVYRINYKAIADGRTVGKDIRLQDGDVIIVPERRLFE